MDGSNPIYVDKLPAAGTVHVIGGDKYIWNGQYFIDLNGRRRDPGVYFSFQPPPTPYAIPTVLSGRPIPVWGDAFGVGNTVVPAAAIEQVRLVRVGVYAAHVKGYRIPIRDDENVPYLGAEIPPMVVVRWAEDTGAATDHVGSYDVVGLDWWDDHVGLRTSPYTSKAPMEWHLEREQDPYPHWVVVLDTHLFGISPKTFVFDLIGQGAGAHHSNSVTSGTFGVEGHWKVEMVFGNQTQDFLATSLASRLNERKLVRGSFDMAGSALTTTFLTSNQLVGGTAFFASMPCVQVTAHHTIGVSVGGLADTSWGAESYGLGFTSSDVNWVDPSGQSKRFRSSVRLDASGKHSLRIDNLSASTRTFFFHAIGFGA